MGTALGLLKVVSIFQEELVHIERLNSLTIVSQWTLLHVYIFSSNLTLFYTFETNFQSTELKLHPLQCFCHCLVVMSYFLLRSLAVGQREEPVGFLAVVVWSNRVHP